MSSMQEENSATPDVPPEEGLTALIARQAIVDEHRAVFGYELFDRSTALDSHTAASDAALLFNALSHGGAESLVGKKLVFINCTHDSLASGHLELVHPDKVVLEIPTLPDGATPEDIDACVLQFEALNKRGFKLAFNQNVLRKAYASWLPRASYIKLDMKAFKPEMAAPLVKFASTNSQAKLVAEKVETAEQYQLMADLGVKLFQGFWFAQPSLVQTKTLRPSQAIIIQLINLIRKQASSTEIEELLKKDPTLSFNLLRFINSSGFGLQCEITSFKHAVMILGLKKLFRWAALLLTTSRNSGSAPAIGTTAVVRGRLMELLALELLSPEECDNAFVVGVFSLLDAMLGIP
ncbi:MAG: EAL and HDOD domain-containing protein, partial [Giesbergeria sp.]